MSRSLRIGIDLDGVVYDFITDSIRAVRRFCELADVLELMRNPPPVTRWNFFEDWGLDSKEFWRIIEKGVADEVVWWHGEPVEGAVETVNALGEVGHKIHVVTNRSGAEEATVAWLNKVGLHYDAVTFTADKASVRLDVLLDDYAVNLAEVARAGVIPVRFAQPWNDHADQFPTVACFDEFASLIGSIADGHDPRGSVARSTSEGDSEQDRATGEVRVVDPTTGGMKGSKPVKLSLVPPRMLQVLGEVYGNGAKKYDRENWRRGYRWSLSFDALMRHALAFWEGEELDDPAKGGDGLPHMMHAAFHCFALATFADEGLGTDDRPYSIAPGNDGEG